MACGTETYVRGGYLSEIFASFQGEGAHVGRRHLFVRFAGCNMRCRYCDTPDSLERATAYTIFGPEPMMRQNPIAPIELRKLVTAMLGSEAPIDALALTGGEPLTQSGFLAEFLRGGAFPCPVLLETNGVLPRQLDEVLPWVDIVSMDIKLASNTGEREFWQEHAQFVERARSKEVYVKILVDHSTADAEVERAVVLLAPVRPAVPVFLQPIVDAVGRPMIDAGRLARLYAMARRHLESVRVLPQVHKLLDIR